MRRLLLLAAVAACGEAPVRETAQDTLPAVPAYVGPKACELLSADDLKQITGADFKPGVVEHDYAGDSQCRFDRAANDSVGVMVSLHAEGRLAPYSRVPGSVAVQGVGDSAVWNAGVRQLAVTHGPAVFSVSFLSEPARRAWAEDLARRAHGKLAAGQ